MKFDLLLTDFRLVRRLLWVGLAYTGGLLGLLLLHSKLSFWGFVAWPVMLSGLLLFWTKLFRRPGWVQVDADGLSWHGPNQEAARSLFFAELHTYRFMPSRNGVALRLCLWSGELVRLDGSFDEGFTALWKALDQAVRRYNQAHVGAEITREKYGLEKFFERRASTKVLYALLAALAVWVGWSAVYRLGPAAYLVPAFLLLPYLLIWANFYYQRR